MNDQKRVVIVGASLAGSTAAEALRAEGFAGSITLIGSERELPYARPPLSKQVLLGEWPVERTRLRSAEELSRLGIRLRLAETARGVDLGAHLVHLEAESVPYDALVIATGVAARPVVLDGGGPPVMSLRTSTDARALHRAFSEEGSGRVAVLGAGVLGSEIASAARKLGRSVTLIGRSRTLSLGAVGQVLSPLLEELHRTNAVDLRLGAPAVALQRRHGRSRLTLGSGDTVEADLVVAALGGVPATAWLEGSGLALDDGVVCDASGRAAAEVYAVGDVARWADPLTGRGTRTEHQANAIEQAMAVAARIARDADTAFPVPFFWSEIHGTRIQAYGSFPAGAELYSTNDDATSGRVWLAMSEGRCAGAIGWNAARAFRAARAGVDEARRTAAETRRIA